MRSFLLINLVLFSFMGFTKNEYECPVSEVTEVTTVLDRNDESPALDPNRPIKDASTDIVTKGFFKTPDTLFNFMSLVYGTINSGIKQYLQEKGINDDKAIYLIFKGGNVLRMIANRVFEMTSSPEVRDLLAAEYNQFFKRSDADFTILVDEKRLNGLDYDQVMNDITQLAYDMQNKIRTEFKANPEKYFNFLQLKPNVASEELIKFAQSLVNTLNEDNNEKWSDVEFTQLQLLNYAANRNLQCPYEGQYDFSMEADPNDPTKIIRTRITDQPDWITVNINKTLEFPSEADPKNFTKFYLVRSKIAFEYFYIKDGVEKRKSEGGEIVDVSIRHRNDFRLRPFLDNYDHELADYVLSYDETSTPITIKAESVEGLSNDLHDIMFILYKRPWDASKYSKRINRLFFLYTVAMMGEYDGIGSDKTKDYLEEINENVIERLKAIYPLKNQDSVAIAEEINKNTAALVSNFPEMKSLNTFLTSLSLLTLEKLTKEPIEGDEENFKEFIELVEKNIATMSKISDMAPAKININDIYKVNMKSLF